VQATKIVSLHETYITKNHSIAAVFR